MKIRVISGDQNITENWLASKQPNRKPHQPHSSMLTTSIVATSFAGLVPLMFFFFRSVINLIVVIVASIKKRYYTSQSSKFSRHSILKPITSLAVSLCCNIPIANLDTTKLATTRLIYLKQLGTQISRGDNEPFGSTLESNEALRLRWTRSPLAVRGERNGADKQN